MRLTASLLLVALLGTALPCVAAEKPNVILILADDLGWTDLGCFGSQYYQTPNVDRLCREGMKFTSAYTCGPNCAPTRACLMSGLYPPRHGIYTVGSGARGQEQFRKMIPAENKITLDPSYVTLAETIKAAGYTTAHAGKWHLGQPGEAGPLEQGFDFNFGGNHSGHPQGGYFSPYKNPELPDGPEGENLTDRLSAEIDGFIRQHKNGPFFVYLPYYAVHTPIQAKADLAAEYARREPHGGHKNPKYAAMIETMDTGIGRILDTLDELDLAKNTVVIFSSDNGGVGGYSAAGVKGAADITGQAPLRGGKGMLYEGGVRVPLIVRWPGVVRPGSQSRQSVISVDFYPTIAEIVGAATPDRLDGVSFVPVLKDPAMDLSRKCLYWHFPGYLQASGKLGTWRTTPGGGILCGDWKLLEFFEDGRLELYNLADDIGQQNDLAKANPTRRDELHAKLLKWRQDVQAPMPRRKVNGE